MAKKVEDVISLDDPPKDTPPPNPEAASEAIEGMVFAEGAPEPAPDALKQIAPGPTPERPKRRTKAELEAEVQRLAALVERQRMEFAAQSPDMLAMARKPLEMTFGAAFHILASWRGEHWELAKAEAGTLAEAWAPCMATVLTKHPEAVMWASALAVTYSVVYPRLQVEKTLAAQSKKEKEGEVILEQA